VAETINWVPRFLSNLNFTSLTTLHFIDNQIVRKRTTAEEAENKCTKITAALANIKLLTSHAWRSHEEWDGSSEIAKIEGIEARAAVLVEQTWTGGNGR